MTARKRRGAKRPRVWLVLIAIAFAAPMTAAYLLYYGGWRPASARPHGELVVPPRLIADIELATLEGTAVRFHSFQRRWSMLTFSSGECAAACERTLYKIQQVITAQGREAGRVRGVMVVTDALALDMLRYQLKDYPDVKAVIGTPANIALLARQFELPAGSPLSGSRRVYIVDPLGNLMMSYPADADPSGIRKDLTRLLRVSRVG